MTPSVIPSLRSSLSGFPRALANGKTTTESWTARLVTNSSFKPGVITKRLNYTGGVLLQQRHPGADDVNFRRDAEALLETLDPAVVVFLNHQRLGLACVRSARNFSFPGSKTT